MVEMTVGNMRVVFVVFLKTSIFDLQICYFAVRCVVCFFQFKQRIRACDHVQLVICMAGMVLAHG